MTETKTAEEPWCKQHRRPRADCRPPWDRHVWSFRLSDELIRQVEAKAKSLGLDRNAGVELALEAWVHEAATGETPSTARTEPPAPAPAPRRETGRKRKDEPAPVAADGDLAATVASLRAQIDEIAERMKPATPRRPRKPAASAVPHVTPGTQVFMEPGADPVVPYMSPEVPARSRKNGRPS